MENSDSIKFFVVLFILLSGATTVYATTNDSTPLKPNETLKGNIVLSANATDYNGPSSTDSKDPLVIIGDRQISPIWDKVISYPVSTYGEIGGSIASFYDANNVYFLLIQDLGISWIAMQWDTTHAIDAESYNKIEMEPMHAGDDMMVFGATEKTGVFGDSNSHGQVDPFITHDIIDNLFWEKVLINDTSGNTVKIGYEVMRSLNTYDVQGHDVVFTPSENVTALLGSNVNHKIDNKVTQIKFVLSRTALSSGIQPTQQNTHTKKPLRNVSFYLFSQLSIGIFIGTVYFSIMVRISIKSINRRL